LGEVLIHYEEVGQDFGKILDEVGVFAFLLIDYSAEGVDFVAG
jgi:hypothetical protein